MFQPELWTPNQDYWGGPFRPRTFTAQSFKEVWFPGVHGDIGGGYPEAESGQVKIPLDWMIRETEPTGLLYVTRTINTIVLGRNSDRYTPLDPLAPLHHSMTRGWKLLEYIPRRVPENSWRRRGDRSSIYLPLQDRRLIPEAAMIHDTARTRLASGSYAPPNLPSSPHFVS
jgi:hypothetical protein